MKSKFPEKLFYKIGEVAEMIDLEPYVLRYWEGEFNFKLTKSKNNQRLYQWKDIEQIERIKKLLYEEKFTIAGAKKRLRDRKKNREEGQLSLTLPPSEQGRSEFKESLRELRKEIRSFLDTLQDAR